MKYFLCIISLFLFYSCAELMFRGKMIGILIILEGNATTQAANMNNPYDHTGQIYYNLLNLFYEQDTLPQSNIAITSKLVSMALADSSFVNLGSNYEFDALTDQSLLLLKEKKLHQMLFHQLLMVKLRLRV